MLNERPACPDLTVERRLSDTPRRPASPDVPEFVSRRAGRTVSEGSVDHLLWRLADDGRPAVFRPM
jgi:hypothetical protein